MHNEFGSVTRNEALVDLIRAEIAAGPLTFARFMALALYHPTLGYYRAGRERIGARGDYVTSPYLSPLFGAIVGRQIAELWARMGEPAAFDLVEMGAGDGRLTRDLCDWATRAAPRLAAALRPLLIEPDTATRELQQRTLAHLPRAPRWVAGLEDLAQGSVQGCVLSNELIDAFPVRAFVMEDGTPREVHVAWKGNQFVEERATPTPGPSPALRERGENGEPGRVASAVSRNAGEGVGVARLPAHIARLISALPNGARFEINEGAPDWIAQVAGVLKRAFVLTFDYGYAAAQLYASWRGQGTLTAFYRHAVSSDLFAHPGEQDLTAHVDFSALALAGAAHGLEPVGFTTQREFLTALGIHQAVSVAGLPLEETLARRRAVLSLLDPAGLGRVRVLVQARGVDGVALAGFAGTPAPMQELLHGLEIGGRGDG